MPETADLQKEYYARLHPFLATGGRAAAAKAEADAILAASPGLASVALPKGNTPLLDALSAGNGWMVNKILVTVLTDDSAPLKKQWDEIRAKPGQKPEAAEREFLDWVGENPKLISKKTMAYLNHKNEDKESALHFAINRMPETAAFLLRAGANTQDINGLKDNVLHAVAELDAPLPAGLKAALKALDTKTLLDQRSMGGHAPYPFQRANPATLSLFMNEFGLDKNDAQSAMRYFVSHLRFPQGTLFAVDNGQPGYLRTYQLTERFAANAVMLAEAGIPLESRAGDRATVMHVLNTYAQSHLPKGHALTEKAAVLLPAYAARLGAVHEKQCMAFLDAALAPNIDRIKDRLVNQRDAEGNTPLFYAMQSRRFDDAHRLILDGARITGLTPEADNIYHLAAQFADESFATSKLAAALKVRPDRDTLLATANKARRNSQPYPQLPAERTMSGAAAEFFLSLDKSIYAATCYEGGPNVLDQMLVSNAERGIEKKARISIREFTAILNHIEQKAPEGVTFRTGHESFARQKYRSAGDPKDRADFIALYSKICTQAVNRYSEEKKQGVAHAEAAEKQLNRAKTFVYSGLETALEFGDSELLAALQEPIASLKKKGVEIDNEIGWRNYRRLARCIERGDVDIAKAVIGLSLPLKNPDGILTTINSGCYEPRGHPEDANVRAFMQFLKDKGERINGQGGPLPFQIAVREGNLSALQRFHEMGMMYPEGQENKYESPLQMLMEKLQETVSPPDANQQAMLDYLIAEESKRAAAAPPPAPGQALPRPETPAAGAADAMGRPR